MKIKSIFATLLLSSGAVVTAQTVQPVLNNNTNTNISIPSKGEFLGSKLVLNGDIEETIIGNTVYDLQTNSAIQPRFVVHENGNMSAAWTYGSSAAAGFPDRGTGYNFYDGTSWGAEPTERLENVRTGWASLVALPNGGEAYICHTSSGNSLFAKRDMAGTGAWATNEVSDGTTTLSNVWHRMTVGGADNNSLHVVGVENLGTDTDPIYHLRYSRSTDLGANWDLVNIEIPVIADSLYGTSSGDSYSIVSKGNEVAFICGGGSKDVVLMKSTDNGTTWVKNIVWDFPIENFDNTSDLIDTTTVTGNDFGAYYTTDGSYNLMYDATGELQAYFGEYLFSNSDTNDNAVTNFSPSVGNLLRWKESYGYSTNGTATLDGSVFGVNQIDTVAFVLDQNGDGEITGSIANYFLALSSMAHTHVANNGDIYLTYSSIIDTISEDQIAVGDPYNKNQRHQWITRSTDNGDSWSNPQDLLKLYSVNEDPLVEAVFGNVVINNDIVYVMYQRDKTPGLNVRGELHPSETNEIVVASFNVADLDVLTLTEDQENVFQLSPNPSFGETTVTLNNGFEASNIEVINSLGQVVYSTTANGNQVTINTSNFTSGLYILNVLEGSKVYSKKLMVK